MTLAALPGATSALLDLVIPASLVVATTCLTIAALDLRGRLRSFRGRTLDLRLPLEGASTEAFFTSLQGLRRSAARALRAGQPWVGLELSGSGGEIGMSLWCPEESVDLVAVLLRGVFPGLAFVAPEAPRPRRCAAVGEFVLARGPYLPLRLRHEGEPLASLVATLAHTTADVSLQILVRPRSSRWQMAAYADAQRLRDARAETWWPRSGGAPVPRATQFERDRARAIETKASEPGFDCAVRAIAMADTDAEARAAVHAISASLLPLGDANALRLGATRSIAPARTSFPRRFPLRGTLLLTARELALLWHAPERSLLEELRPPRDRAPAGAEKGERVIGTSLAGGRVGLSVADARAHLHVLGSTGTGKTTLLLGLAARDIAAGRGVAVLDPKGDLVRGLLERIPSSRICDVVLISPDEAARSVGIDPLELAPGDDRDLVAENALSIFRRIYERYWGPRTDDVLKSALLTLLQRPGSTLAHVPLLLQDDEYRAAALKGLDDPLGLERFWDWYEELSDRERRDAAGPLLNKLRDFLLRPRLRRLLCPVRSTVDVRALVGEGKILLADLSVGRWGEAAASLVGSFLVARIWQAVLARAALPEEERRDFFLFIDEFQHFLGIAGPFADALAEARSLRLSLTIANQHLGQLTRELRDAVASNARSRVVFQCGQDDAAYLARELAPLDAGALLSLGRYEAAVRLLVEGRTSEAFRLRTSPCPLRPDPAVAAKVRAASAATFARSAADLDAELLATLPERLARAEDTRWRRREGPTSAVGEVWSSHHTVLSRSRTKAPRRAVTTPPEGPAPV